MEFVAQCQQAAFIRADRLRREIEAERGARNERYDFTTGILHHVLMPCFARIFQRLKDLGYGNEVERLNEVDPTILSEHPSIKQIKEFTERGGFPDLYTYVCALIRKRLSLGHYVTGARRANGRYKRKDSKEATQILAKETSATGFRRI
jgi:hypothetical protein